MISLKTRLISFLFKLAGIPWLKPLVVIFFNHMNQFLPIDRLYEGEFWEAFHHPNPSYPLHILMLPKSAIPSLVQAPKNQIDFYSDLFSIIQHLIQDFNLEERGYRLITNGGPNQSLPQWHWHLISEEDNSH